MSKKMQSEKLTKVPTGIRGLDEITLGGLPKGRATLITGGAGCGKTILSTEFLIRGIEKYHEPGVFITFEETKQELIQNVATLGFDLEKLIEEKKLYVDHILIDLENIQEVGDFDLQPLFIRIEQAIKAVGAKRIVLDTIEVLFSAFKNEAVIRSELSRLLQWLKSTGVTAIVTGEMGKDQAITRHGLEEYVADCVLFLDNQSLNQISTRRLRVIKYRGSKHGTNEYPFIIGAKGISIYPITSLSLDYVTSNKRVSTGIDRLDRLLGGEGYFKGSCVMISGATGSGKSSIAASFAKSMHRMKKKCIFFASEEPPHQIIRNMASIGIELQSAIDEGYLKIIATRSMHYGLETHLVNFMDEVQNFEPEAMIIDPISNLLRVGNPHDVNSMLTRMIDFLKGKQITCLVTYLFLHESDEATEIDISSLMDTWIKMSNHEINGERNRQIVIIKSRGMNHSNQVREFIMSDHGIELRDVYVGDGQVFTGTARIERERNELVQSRLQEYETKKREAEIVAKRQVLQSQILLLQNEIKSNEMQMEQEKLISVLEKKADENTMHSFLKSRRADVVLERGDLKDKRKQNRGMKGNARKK